MPEHIFTSRFRTCLFLLLRNDRVWNMLSTKERAKLLLNNIEHNTLREDYRDPSQYGGGRNFDVERDRLENLSGVWLKRFLDENRPRSVIEYGPGAGYYTRLVAEHPSVSRYLGVEINPRFADYLEHKLAGLGKAGFTASVYRGDFMGMQAEPAEAIVFMNTLHHIPNRGDLFMKLKDLVRPGGKVLCVEPSHYISRILQLIGKIRSPGYVEKYVIGNRQTATHHHCTLGESKMLCRRTGAFSIVSYEYDAAWPRPIRALIKLANGLGLPDRHRMRRTFLHRVLSQKIFVEFERRWDE
jgi:SAM-dependent methyltransferase